MHRTFIAVIALSTVALAPLIACSPENDFSVGAVDSGFMADSAAPSDDTADEDSTDAAPVWYRVSGQLTLVEGALERGSLSLEVYGEVVEDGALCLVERPIEDIDAREATPDPIVYHWWGLGLGDPEEPPCADTLPDALMLGLGGLHAELEPSVARDGYADVANGLYGAYVNVAAAGSDDPDGTAYLLGYAGTEAAYAGQSLAVEEGPLPDGTYRVRGSFLQRL